MSTDAQNLLASFDALPADEKQVVAAAIAAKCAGSDVQRAGDSATSSDEAAEPRLTGQAWAVEFQKWARSHDNYNPNVDTSRESIYEGRGL